MADEPKATFLQQILHIAARECRIFLKNPIYGFCTIVFPIIVILFFTTMLKNGQPTDMPVGVVDLDNTSTSRAMIRKLDAFQTTKVVAHYPNVNEARRAIQRNKIYAFLYIPKGTTSELLQSKQPKISFYYSNVTMLAGNLTYRDLKTIALLGNAGVGSTKLSALGKTEREIKAFLQPITIDLHLVNNPTVNYNVYLTTMIVPGILMLFVFLITAYSLGTEMKFDTAKEWMHLAGDNIHIALLGKLLPQTLIWMIIFFGYDFYVFKVLQFPCPGGATPIILLTLLTIFACHAFGIFVFGLMPSLRMSMSVCSLWGVLSFTTSGATFPIFAMSPMIESMAQLFPLRHYYMIYQQAVFNGYPIIDSWFNIMALCIFICLPVFIIRKLKNAMLTYVYIP